MGCGHSLEYNSTHHPLDCRGDGWNSTQRKSRTVHKAGIFLTHTLVDALAAGCGISRKSDCEGGHDLNNIGILRRLEGPHKELLHTRSVNFVRDPMALVVSGMLYHRGLEGAGEDWLKKPLHASNGHDYGEAGQLALFDAARTSMMLPPVQPGESYQGYLRRMPEEKALLAEMVRVARVAPISPMYTRRSGAPPYAPASSPNPSSDLSINVKNAANPSMYISMRTDDAHLAQPQAAHVCLDTISHLDTASHERMVARILQYWRVPQAALAITAPFISRHIRLNQSVPPPHNRTGTAHATGGGSRVDLLVAVCQLDADYFGGLFFSAATRVGCMPKFAIGAGAEQPSPSETKRSELKGSWMFPTWAQHQRASASNSKASAAIRRHSHCRTYRNAF